MSHTVNAQTTMTQGGAIADACKELGLTPPTRETVEFYDGRQVTGTCIRLPGWRQPIVLAEDGRATFDNFEGRWGKLEELNRFRQHYTLAVTRRAMPGYRITTAPQADGSLRVVMER